MGRVAKYVIELLEEVLGEEAERGDHGAPRAGLSSPPESVTSKHEALVPGSFFTIVCPGCGAEHVVHTGASAAKGQVWAYEQLICPRCQTLESRSEPDLFDEYPPGCDGCGGELEPWSGRIWHDRTEEGHVGAEHVGGPCPRCGGQFTLENATTIGLWD